MLLMKLFLGFLKFFQETLLLDIYSPSQLFVFDLARNVPTKLKSVMSSEPVILNVNFASVPVSTG